MRHFWKNYRVIAIIAIINIGFILAFMFLPPFNDYSGHPDSDQFSHYGTFINGLFGTLLALLNSVLIYITYKTQHEQFNQAQVNQKEQYSKTLRQQKEHFETTLQDERERFNKEQEQVKEEAAKKEETFKSEKQQQEKFFTSERFENRLFEMIRSNRAIVSEMEYETPDDYTETYAKPYGKNIKYVTVKGQKVFVKIQLHFIEAMNECTDIFIEYFSKKEIFKDQISRKKEINTLQNYFKEKYNEGLLEDIIKINIIYLCIFYGMGESGLPILRNTFEPVYNQELINKILHRLKRKPVKWDPLWIRFNSPAAQKFLHNDEEPKEPLDGDNFIKYYGGHHHRLGHYFRHLFMLVNYVNSDASLKYPERLEYIKYLRSQLSTYEQSIFFLNSISFLGRIWEITAELNNKVSTLVDKQLITKYNLVKNVPSGFIPGIDLNKYYPLVEFELIEDNLVKETLKALYN